MGRQHASHEEKNTQGAFKTPTMELLTAPEEARRTISRSKGGVDDGSKAQLHTVTVLLIAE